ncbi:short chain dehydrogenase [Streptomyces albidoflavus]|uniref:SDR family oxidoreductase n=1 Tax=Streptomyces albidoflavus TaxID=1886 RepID=UPI000BAE43EE|nr:SDR family oxidoreductase [Streptomyces albidoflavus]PAX88976.1 short chain dehydrogenase [Streptomyces albidoflavus]PAX90643.1 short chain dehydrogenase [Streptomyces albidoflavus]PBO18023.1 short chain dehydrogenase [Streptomyces albidoflavus]PBO24385.1 short chain dehydrogenase [Streptomyces albidoflavus]PBO27317.1 short chain dehydrogenase [Streptomyces albidoflavus]
MGGLSGARERSVHTGGVELRVAELGDASRPTVILVHGYPDSKEVWSAVAARLADRYHVVLYDIRGHGRSTAPRPLRGGFTLEKLTDDFLAVVDAVSPDAPVHIVGHDWGSVQSWEFATVERTRGRVASFTSLSGPSLDHFGHWIKKRAARPTPRRLAQLVSQGAKSWYVYMLHTPALPELAWRGPLGKRWPRILERLEKVPAGDYPTSSLGNDAAHGAWLYRDNVRTRLRHPRPDPYAHAPVQLITPTGDIFLSERLYDELESWVPQLVRRTIPAKHWVPRTRPDQLAAWIGEFVDSQEALRQSGRATSLTLVEGGRPRGSARRRAALARYAERFAGQLVLVTGAAGGIGRATALAFAAAGARVIAADRDGAGAAGTARAALAAGAPHAWAETVDVGDEQTMEKFAAKVAAEYGTVDVLVNNAGVGLSGSLLDTTPEEWRRVLDVNLWGVIHGCRLFGRQMAERNQGGHIVNLASAAAYLPSKTLPAYSTSKAAVLMLSESLRAELAPRSIGVTAICPGIVNTGITRTSRFAGASKEDEAKHQQRAAKLYGMRNYPPEKVADAILRAVLDNSAVVPVTPKARGSRLLARLSPKGARAFARLNPPV